MKSEWEKEHFLEDREVETSEIWSVHFCVYSVKTSEKSRWK
jgi:hypothetical protein